jgi:hypothetical protein
MRTLSSTVAVGSLILAAALVPVIGGVLTAVFLVGLFFLALVGVLSGVEDRTVRQRNPTMDPRRWRDGS